MATARCASPAAPTWADCLVTRRDSRRIGRAAAEPAAVSNAFQAAARPKPPASPPARQHRGVLPNVCAHDALYRPRGAARAHRGPDRGRRSQGHPSWRLRHGPGSFRTGAAARGLLRRETLRLLRQRHRRADDGPAGEGRRAGRWRCCAPASPSPRPPKPWRCSAGRRSSSTCCPIRSTWTRPRWRRESPRRARPGLNPAGVIAVDLFGQPADYESIEAICAREKLWLICDAAQAFGASYRGRKLGTLRHGDHHQLLPRQAARRLWRRRRHLHR